MGSAQAHKGGNQDDGLLEIRLGRQGFHIWGRLKKLQAIPQPLDGGTRDKYAAFECILRLAVQGRRQGAQ
jgi:hypothetical protein